MLISKEEIKKYFKEHNIVITGVLHVGAHECEELSAYEYLGIPSRYVIWIDALPDKVEQQKKRGIPNVYQAVISDTDGEHVVFKRTNNNQSSSILEFGTHENSYPWCVVTERILMSTNKIDTFMKMHNLNASKYNFWNFDIQGAELKALIGGEESLKNVNAIYLEVNTEEVYKGCAKMSDIDTFLSYRGFKRVITLIVKEGWGDALYVKN